MRFPKLRGDSGETSVRISLSQALTQTGSQLESGMQLKMQKMWLKTV